MGELNLNPTTLTKILYGGKEGRSGWGSPENFHGAWVKFPTPREPSSIGGGRGTSRKKRKPRLN